MLGSGNYVLHGFAEIEPYHILRIRDIGPGHWEHTYASRILCTLHTVCTYVPISDKGTIVITNVGRFYMLPPDDDESTLEFSGSGHAHLFMPAVAIP